jgi:periplasmic protein TonB
MTQQAADDLQTGSRVIRAEQADERLTARHLVAALALHILAVVGALFLPAVDAAEEEIVTVDLVLQEGGEAGTSGGSQSAESGGATEAAQPAPQTALETAPDITPEPVAVAPVVAPPPPKPQQKPVPREAKVEPRPEPQLAKADPAPPAPTTAPSIASSAGEPTGEVGRGQGGPAGVGHGNQGEGAGAFGSGDGPGDEYFERLRRHLARYKNYPKEALKRKEAGTVVVEFVLARDGRVLTAQIEKSSGSELIDRAAIDMLDRASPVPPLPDRYKGERIKIAIPVDFSIGFFGRLF